jgi:DNA-directed RNA polymerase specialized sigma24 family protein
MPNMSAKKTTNRNTEIEKALEQYGRLMRWKIAKIIPRPTSDRVDDVYQIACLAVVRYWQVGKKNYACWFSNIAKHAAMNFSALVYENGYLYRGRLRRVRLIEIEAADVLVK